MSHAAIESPHRGWRAYFLPYSILSLWLAAVLVLGYIGFEKAHPDSTASDRIFWSLQLLALHGEHVPDQLNWDSNPALELARFLAPTGELAGLFLGTVALLMLVERFRLWVFWLDPRKHVVVCGLGRKGLHLVKDLRAEFPVLVIEEDASNPNIAACGELGATVMIADATKGSTLERARIHKARHLIAICGEDGTNVEIAVRADALLARRKPPLASRLDCRLHVKSLELQSLFQRHKMLTKPDSGLQASMFNVFENSARILFKHHFLDHGRPVTQPDDPRQAHLVILGFGEVGESVALEALKMTHFPNGRHLRLTVIDLKAFRRRNHFLARYEHFLEFCDAAFVEEDAWSPNVSRSIQEWCAERDSIVTLVVSLGNDSQNLPAALYLATKVRNSHLPILVSLESGPKLNPEVLAPLNITPFGHIEDACSQNVVIGEELDQLARTIHEEFSHERRAEGRPSQDPSVQPWDKLDPDLKESNRQQADHIPFKLRVMGCYAADHPTPGDQVVEKIFGADQTKLAQMEHHRWWVERSLAGWRPGEKKDVRERTHPDMKPWKDLSPDVREYDLEAVSLIPKLLHNHVYREQPKSDADAKD